MSATGLDEHNKGAKAGFLFLLFPALLRPIAGLMVCASLFFLSASLGFADVTPVQIGTDNISATTNGVIPTMFAGQTIPLPDIVITENWIGALRPDGFVAIAAPFDQISAFDVSAATLKAYRVSDNVEITWAVIGSNKLIVDSSPSADNVLDAVFKLTAASTAYTGPAKLVISNLKAKLANTASAGDMKLTIGGAETSGGALDTLQKIDGNLGSGAARITLKVAVVAGTGDPLPNIIVTGTITSQTIRAGINIAGNDLGKQGSVFVAAIFSSIFSVTEVYFMNSASAWERFSSCATAPSYYTGMLNQTGNTDIPVVPAPTDLSAFRGVELYVGYGISGTTTACENMLNYGTYSMVLTVK